ncbi:MAG: sensor histidine kinase [Rufibacter sp.]
MLEAPSEVVTGIVAGTVILLLLVFFLVSFLFIYQKKQHQHLKEKQQLKVAHERALRESQLEIQEETLKYVGRELHDNVGQILSLVKLHLHDPQNLDQVTYARDLVAGAITDVRALSKTLNTEWADGLSLADLIRQELEKIERSGSLQTEFLHEGNDCQPDLRSKVILFRVFQECLQNILKHAQATVITVNLHLLMAEGMCILEVTDNGIGFDLASAPGGAGLANIRKRIETIQGQVQIKSRLNSGTLVEIRYPAAPTCLTP